MDKSGRIEEEPTCTDKDEVVLLAAFFDGVYGYVDLRLL